MKRFEYIRPHSMDEALNALEVEDNPYLLAGGTDLLVGMKGKTIRPKCIIDIKGIPNMNSIQYHDGFELGALSTVRDVEVSPLIREKLPALSMAASMLGSVQIRNRATVAGNLCHGSPAADMAAILLGMNCEVRIVSPKGEKTRSLEGFFSGPQKTVLEKNEMVSRIIIPKSIESYKGIYLKHGPRKAMDIGIVNIAILLDVDYRDRFCKQITIALGAVAPTPMRAKKAEAVAKGKALTSECIREVAETASSESKPISDFRASADYRRELVKSLVARGIHQIMEQNARK